MTSEIRANTLKNRVGLGTVEYTNTGIVVSGIVTANSFSGPLTATSIDLNGDLDVDGHTNLDNVSIAGVTTMTGNLSVGETLTVSGNNPNITFTDTNSNPDYKIYGSNGAFTILDSTNSVNRFAISSDGNIAISNDLDVDGHTNLDNVSIVGVATVTGSNINIEGGSASLSQLKINSTGRYRGIQLDENGTRKAHFQHDATDNKLVVGTAEGTMQFNSGDTPRVTLNSSGHWVPYADSTYDLGLTGTRWRNLYADTLYGDGSNITGIAVTEAPVTDYTITGDGSHYYFHGGGVDETAGDPDLYLIRGQKYRFNNTTGSSHPFAIREASGGSAYSNGVTGSQNGIQFFTVPYDAPAKIFYQCTVHGGMVGNIYIRGANGNNNNVGVTTFTGAVRQKGNPVFIAYRTSTYSLTTSDTEMVYTNERIDVGGNYNPSNGRFTAPVTGLYEFAYATIAHNSNTVYRFQLKVNGSLPYDPMKLELRIHNVSSQYGTNGEYVCYVNMTAGQYASVFARADTNVSCYGDSNFGYTYFRGRLVG